MKKILLLSCIACMLSACSINGTMDRTEPWHSQPVEEQDAVTSPQLQKEWSVVTVKQGNETMSLYELFVSTYSYDRHSDSFICGDGPRLHNILADIAGELPLIRWDSHCSIQIPANLQLTEIQIFGSDYNKLDSLDDGPLRFRQKGYSEVKLLDGSELIIFLYFY